MSFKTDAEHYGLQAFSVVPGPASDLTLATGKTKYGKASFGPTGLLLRTLTKIEDAVDYGGLLITDSAGLRWQFYAGDTLKAVLANGLLGRCATNMSNAADPDSAGELELTRSFPLRRSMVSGGQYNFTVHPLVISRPRPVVTQYWDANANVKIFGVVTGASSGYGQSHHRGLVASSNASFDAFYRTEFSQAPGDATFPIYSFMRTDVPMRVTFAEFVSRTVEAMLTSIPSDIRGYYERTRESALSPFGPLKPTVAVHTCWNNGQLIDTIPVLQPKSLERVFRLDLLVSNLTGVVTRQPSPPVGDGHASTPWVGALRGLSGSMQYNTGQAGPAFNANEVFDYYVSDFGQYARDCPLPFVCWTNVSYAPGSRPHLTGTMEGLAAGQLKDGHVLARALMTGARYAASEAVQQDVMEVLRSQTGPTRESELFNRTSVDSTGTQAAADNNAAALTDLLGSTKFKDSAYDTGTLMKVLSDFIDSWDKKAYALARSEN